MSSRHVVLAALFLASVSALAVTAQQSGTPEAKPYKDPARKQSATQDEGARLFERRCSNCHTAPDGFSARISGTVARHMRVRASLSQSEERKLLHFLNP
jgi:mono/diheme cytochrome c family protein